MASTRHFGRLSDQLIGGGGSHTTKLNPVGTRRLATAAGAWRVPWPFACAQWLDDPYKLLRSPPCQPSPERQPTAHYPLHHRRGARQLHPPLPPGGHCRCLHRQILNTAARTLSSAASGAPPLPHPPPVAVQLQTVQVRARAENIRMMLKYADIPYTNEVQLPMHDCHMWLLPPNTHRITTPHGRAMTQPPPTLAAQIIGGPAWQVNRPTHQRRACQRPRCSNVGRADTGGQGRSAVR